jgi:hypothetical protein
MSEEPLSEEKREKKRKQRIAALKEVVSSEASYVADLR